MKWIVGLLALILLAGCAPLAITDIKVVTVDDAGYQCLSWSTNQDAQCKVTYCEGNLCSTSPLEPEYGTLHCIGIPAGGKDIAITAIGTNGQAATVEVK